MRNSEGLTLESSATAVTPTVGKPNPSTCQVRTVVGGLEHAAVAANDYSSRSAAGTRIDRDRVQRQVRQRIGPGAADIGPIDASIGGS